MLLDSLSSLTILLVVKHHSSNVVNGTIQLLLPFLIFLACACFYLFIYLIELLRKIPKASEMNQLVINEEEESREELVLYESESTDERL